MPSLRCREVRLSHLFPCIILRLKRIVKPKAYISKIVLAICTLLAYTLGQEGCILQTNDVAAHQRAIFAKNFTALLERLGKTQADVSADLNITASTVSDWAKGKKYPRVDKIKALADYLGVMPSDLREEAHPNARKNIMIPVLGSVPAGIPLEAVEDIIDWEEIPESMLAGGKEYFALQVKGDSMTPRYEPGDVLIVRRQETCDSGQDCIVMVNGNDATFKRVQKDEASLTLKPLNPNYDVMTFTPYQAATLPVKILGVVVELRRKI